MGCGSVQEVVDAVVKEQLLQSLPEDVRVWVSERKPATSAETGRFAEKHLQAGGSRRVGAGNRKGRVGYRSRDAILKCGQLGHLARECSGAGKVPGPIFLPEGK